MERRIDYTFKALSICGMLCVLAGHFGSHALCFTHLYEYDTFHMPLFLFISGYFFRSENAQGIRDVFGFIKKKFLRLMVPYFIWNFVYFGIMLLLQNNPIFSFSIFTGEVTWKNFVLVPFQTGRGFAYNVAAWFVPFLFLVESLYCVGRYCFVKVFRNREFPLVVVFFLIAYAGIRLSRLEWAGLWRIGVTRAMYGAFWYAFAVYYREKLETIDQKMPALVAIAGNMLVSAFLVLRFGNDTPVLYTANFSMRAALIFLRAGLGIWFWLRICRLLAPAVARSKAALFFADHTFSVMMHQGLAGLILNGLLYKSRLVSGFDVDAYRSRIWFGVGPDAFRVVYLILIPAMILIPVWFIEKHTKSRFVKNLF